MADATAQGLQFDSPQAVAKDVDGSGGRVGEGPTHSQDGAFACAVGAEHHPLLAAADGEGDVVQNLFAVAAERDVVQFKDGGHVWKRPWPVTCRKRTRG